MTAKKPKAREEVKHVFDQEEVGVKRPYNATVRSVFKPKYVEEVAHLCALGATNAEIARFYDVDELTFIRWGRLHPELAHALKDGRDMADERVVRSLYQRAIGYKHDAVKIFLPKDSLEPVYAGYEEHVQPDVTACIFWLKNRRPDLWRDKREYTGLLKDDRTNETAELTDAQLDERIVSALERLEGAKRPPGGAAGAAQGKNGRSDVRQHH